MARVFVPRERGDSRVVQAGQTLAAIAGLCPASDNISWQEVALFNFATVEPPEVNRALIEQFGCREAEIDWANPQNTIIRPTVPNPVIRLPKLFSEVLLPLNRTYTVRVKDPLPAPAVRIDALDKWFRPNYETCDIRYSLEGILKRANLLDMDIFASNYCEAVPKKKDDFLTFSYKPLDLPIKRITLGKQLQRVQNNVSWSGDSEAARGVLAKRGNVNHLVNVAQSPYTILVRYYKDDADRNAKLDLFPFWPEFQTPTSATPKSLAIRWKVTGTSKLKYGQILVYDTDPGNPNRVVLRKPLRPADLTLGEHTFQWDGVRNDGTPLEQNKTPYRVQIQAHSGIDEDEGLAFAAMHTEVRLFAHQNLGTNADPVADPQCLHFALAPHWPGPAPDADSTKETQLRLAQYGYHPGPVDGKNRDELEQAVREFQRSHAENAAAPFDRLKMDGSAGSKTRAALSRAVADERPMFGDPANRSDLQPATAETRLTDKAQSLIMWVDDRHVYTDLTNKPPTPLHQMDNYRGKMDISDERVNKDKDSIPRPWIPMSAAPAILSKNDPMLPNAAIPSLAALPDMAKAIGPIRLDWTFTELVQADLLGGIFVGADAAAKSRTRTKAYLEHVTGPNGVGLTQGGKTYVNAPEYIDPAPASHMGDNTDPTIDTQINRLVFVVDPGANAVTVDFPNGPSISAADAANAINGAMGAVPATATAPANFFRISTNANGVGHEVRVGPGSSKPLLQQLNLEDSVGTATSPGKLESGGFGGLNTSDQTRLRLRVDGRAVTVTLTSGRNVAKATIVNDINTALTNAGLGARARLDDANRIILESNGFGTNRSIDIRASSSTLLLTRLGLAAGQTDGTATAAATVSTNAVPTFDTASVNLLVLRVNGIRVEVRFTKDEQLKKKQATAEIEAVCKAIGVNVTAEFDETTGFITISTEEEGANQSLEVHVDSNAELLVRLGLAVGNNAGGGGAPAAVTTTVAGETFDTSDPTRLHFHVDGKAVTAILSTSATLSATQAAKEIQAAILDAGVAAKATETGGVITIETTGTGKGRTVKIGSTSAKFLLQQLGMEPGTHKSSGGQSFCGGIRPKDLGVYYRAPFGYGTESSLVPWLAVDDQGKKTIATIVHDDLGQDAEQVFAALRGRAGVYFRPSRIAGDGYRPSAAVSFEPMPDGSGHPNWAVLRPRYPKLPFGHTAKLQTWRKASIRGYIGWTDAPAAPPGPDATTAASYYADAHVHFVDEGLAPFAPAAIHQYAVPTPIALAPANSVITGADFQVIVRRRLDVRKSSYRNVPSALAPGYVWPYLHRPNYGITPRREAMSTYEDWLGDLENWTWDLVNEELLQRMIYNIERLTARMRGHLLVEFTSTPDLELREYQCDTCDFIETYVVNQPFVGGLNPGGVDEPWNNGDPCPTACGGSLGMTASVYPDGLPFSAIGLGMGASWLYQPRLVETWAHEMGHHRHLEHAQAQGGTSPTGAPGYQVTQHDIAGNPPYAGVGQWHQRAWDRHCVMSYDKSQPRRFCGKCALRQRGWAVVYLANAPGHIQDP